MYAIVLTYDRQIEFASLLVKSYLETWKDCPLRFRIPYNDFEKISDVQQSLVSCKVDFIRTKSDIRSTIQSLLQDIGDEEFVFWSIDDRYPIKVRDLKALNNIFELIEKFANTRIKNIDSIKIFTHPEVVWRKRFETTEAYDISSFTFLDLKFYSQKIFPSRGFYMHHFTRARILRKYFLSEMLPKVYRLREFHEYIKSFQDIEEKILVLQKPIIDFAEPCIGGKLTLNGRHDLEKYRINLPDVPRCDRILVYSQYGQTLTTLKYKLKSLLRTE